MNHDQDLDVLINEQARELINDLESELRAAAAVPVRRYPWFAVEGFPKEYPEPTDD